MRINAKGPDSFLEEFRLYLQDQFEKSGYLKGPKVGTLDSGMVVNYVKGESIVCIQMTEQSEGRESGIHVEAEEDLPEVREIWDRALTIYGKAILKRLSGMAIDEKALKAELKK